MTGVDEVEFAASIGLALGPYVTMMYVFGRGGGGGGGE